RDDEEGGAERSNKGRQREWSADGGRSADENPRAGRGVLRGAVPGEGVPTRRVDAPICGPRVRLGRAAPPRRFIAGFLAHLGPLRGSTGAGARAVPRRASCTALQLGL